MVNFMCNLIDIETIIKNEIDENNYMDTFLSSLVNHNVISLDEYEQIILNLLKLLEIKIKKYTGELTSSVTISTAQNINTSNMWTISLVLKNNNVKKNIDTLLYDDIIKTYNYGKEKLIALISKTQFFYNVVFLNTDNYFYNATLKDGIKCFFELYNFDYDSENICITVDYDSYLERSKLKGIEFIKKYLEYINYENIFCNQFN